MSEQNLELRATRKLPTHWSSMGRTRRNFSGDPSHVMPADLAQSYQVERQGSDP
jgi:hypothetical protein